MKTMKNQFPNIKPSLPPKKSLAFGTSRMIWKWSFPKERLGETVVIDGMECKKLLTLDLNIPDEEFAEKVNSAPLLEAAQVFAKQYPCPHRCPGCFNEASLRNPILTMGELWGIVSQAKKLGLESVKFLGPGELIANPDLFLILDEFKRREIVVGIFTKGAILGNDVLAMHYHRVSSSELVSRLAKYDNITFLVGGRSFDPHFENLFVPRNKEVINVGFNYHAARNLAIERLCEAGFNSDVQRPRLAIICSPVTRQNLGCVGEIFKWGAERNIPVYLPPTMVSGKGHLLVKSCSESCFEDDYIDLAVDIYTWAIGRGIITLEQFLEEGPHPYIGVAPCNQLTHGLYVHYDGTVQRCPGNDTPDFVVHHDIRSKPLIDIWKGSKNYSLNQFNNGCVKDGVSLPKRFYSEVKARVKHHFKKR